MPTRIVLDVSGKKSRTPPRKRGDEENPRNRSIPALASPRASTRRIVKLRSSIFRETPEEEPEEDTGRLSTTDIRTSPRLVGYLYQLLASSILLITVVKFYRLSQDETSELEVLFKVSATTDKRIFQSVNGPIYYWKLVGAAIMGSVGTCICLIIVLAHFDTFCLPRLWYMAFRDKSRFEQNVLRSLVLFWAVALHVCTSSLSVGQVQGNVYFTTWIGFASSAVNYGVWRVSAGYQSLAERVNLHDRETTYNWLWTWLCICVFAAATTDMYINRDEITFRQKGEVLTVSQRDWKLILAIVWGFATLSMVALLLNHYSTKSLEVNICGGRSRFVCGWRQSEGFLILAMVGVFFWVIFEHTGVDGVVNGLNNAYFGVWGSFFNSVFLLGTWLRENKNLEYIVLNRGNRR